MEKDIVTSILKYLRTIPYCFCWKEHISSFSQAGIPDIIACIDGKFYGFEVKNGKNKLTKLQELTLQKIRDAHGQAFKVTSVDEVKRVLEVISNDKK